MPLFNIVTVSSIKWKFESLLTKNIPSWVKCIFHNRLQTKQRVDKSCRPWEHHSSTKCIGTHIAVKYTSSHSESLLGISKLTTNI